jgi:hypothetical protein
VLNVLDICLPAKRTKEVHGDKLNRHLNADVEQCLGRCVAQVV